MSTSDNHMVPANKEHLFDVVITSQALKNTTGLKNIGELIFKRLPHRSEDATILQSHINDQFVEVNLIELRNIIGNLFVTFHKKGIKRGDTVLLATMESNSEIFIAILFLALASFGVKVFLPMYLEKELIQYWHTTQDFDFIIIPGNEILELNDHDRQKRNIKHLMEFGLKQHIPCLDIFDDLKLNSLIANPESPRSENGFDFINEIQQTVSGNDIALMITTSGTSGESKIVRYNHHSFLLNLSAWEKAGLFQKDKLGGRGFTPLFTHTMGIRCLLNGLWLGQVVILITTDWFTEKPESVAYFLKLSKPEHITGGPAVFNMFLEMSRVFPDLKNELRQSLKTLVSSGTTVDFEVNKKIKEAFNLSPQNAFGSTETQQALNTLIEDRETSAGSKSLGAVFPGVSIGLKKNDHSDVYRMFIKSDFGCHDIIEADKINTLNNQYIYLGDTVKLEDGKLLYHKREKEDYLNDEFGMKVPLNKLKDNYHHLFSSFDHIKILPLKFKPGLGSIIFLNNVQFLNKQERKKAEIHAHEIIEKINHDLFTSLEPLQFNHWTINRFCVVSALDVQNRKGIISDYKISLVHNNLKRHITEDNLPTTGIVDVRSILEKPNDYSKYHNPYIGNLLKCLDMDVSYDTAKNDYVYVNDKEQKKKVLDLTGGYGTNLIGHHNEELIDHAVKFLKSGKISLSDQLSIQKSTGELAKKLNELISRQTGKSYFVLFGSSGSEVVEIAIHHAYLEWMKRVKKLEQKQISKYAYKNKSDFKNVWKANWKKIGNAQPAIIANQEAFHGTSSGARSLMGDKRRRNKFRKLTNISTLFINDLSHDLNKDIAIAVENSSVEIDLFSELDNKLKLKTHKLSTIIAAFVEPVIGEGGIRQINSEFPQLLSNYEFPLIVDEIQSGLGRTGTFLSSNDFTGNYYLFSKALGGNIAKISAIAIEKEKFIEKIGKLYVSTFADGALAATIALENLNIIDRNNIPKKAGLKGKELMCQLQTLVDKYPDVIESIDGTGLMIGIKFSFIAINRNLFLRVLYHKKVLGYLFSSYLLNHHNLRILPSISASNVLRVEPSVCIEKEDIDKLKTGIEQLADLIDQGKFYYLTKHLMKGDPFVDNKGKQPGFGSMHQTIDTPADGAIKVAFLAHFVYPEEELRMLSNDLCNASDTGLKLLFSKFEMMMDMEPFILNARNIHNGKIHLTTILLPLDSAELEKLHRTSKKNKVIRKIQKAVQKAADAGIEVISLGGYSSIISDNGKAILEPEGTKIVTGNTLTAVIGYHNFKEKITALFGTDEINIGIVGATGNIGRILAKSFITDVSITLKSLYLIGRNKKRLDDLKEELFMNSHPQNTDLIFSTDLDSLKNCNVIINAANSNDPIIYPEHINNNFQIIMTDISVPTGISDELQKYPNVQIVQFVSSIALHEDPDFLVTSCSPRGTALCCTAEAILSGFENIDLELKGDITDEGFNTIYKLAKKHQFILNTNSIKSYKSNVKNEVSV